MQTLLFTIIHARSRKGELTRVRMESNNIWQGKHGYRIEFDIVRNVYGSRIIIKKYQELFD